MFEPGQTKKGGRKKGKCNGSTEKLRELVLGALDEVGGQAYLAKQALENPTAFMSLIGKIIPKELEVKGGQGLLNITIITGDNKLS